MRFFPNLNWVNTVSKLLDAVFEGSNDNLNWQLIGKVDQTAHTGWNVIKSLSQQPFKFIRFAHTN